MRCPRLFACLVLAFHLATAVASAQIDSLWLQRGVDALDTHQYNQAIDAFERVLKKEPRTTAVRFLLAKAYLGQGNLREADKSIVRVIREDSTRLEYLELQLAIGFPREPLEILRRTRRDELSAKILMVDSLNAMANLQLGKGQMYEWLEWRERLTVNGLTPAPDGWIGPTRPRFGDVGAGSVDPLKQEHSPENATRVPDPFDLERQKISGHEIFSLSKRAEVAYPKAERFLKRVLDREPANQEAYLSLAKLYMTRPNTINLKLLARQMKEHLPSAYYSWMLSGYADHYLGNADEAEKAFIEARKLMPDSIKAVYDDVDRLLNKAGLKAKQGAQNFDVATFWQTRDPRLLTESNERISEHHARVLHAGLLFSEPLINLQGWDADRGKILIRYGLPDSDFQMSNTVAECGADFVHQSDGLYHVFQYPNGRFVFEQRMANANDFPFYAPCAQVVATRGGIGAANDYQIKAEDEIYENPESYSHEVGDKRIAFPFLASQFKGPQGAVDVYVPYAIPVEMSALRVNQVLSLESGAFLLAEGQGVASAKRRTVTEVKSDELTQFDGATVWIDAHHVTAVPGTYGLSVEFETKSGSGIGFARETVELRAFGSNQLQMSDLLLAYFVEEMVSVPNEAPPGYLLRNGLEIKPAPWGVFNRSQPVYLYFEMYNLAKNPEGGTRYQVETVMIAYREEKGLAKVLRKAFRGRADEGVSVRFENTGITADDGQYLILDAADQPPGTYVIVMRIKDLIADEEIETRRLILLE